MSQRVALVTGGAKRIGRSISERLAEAGYDLVINHHASDIEAEDIKRVIEAMGRQCLIMKADISCAEAVHHMFEEVMNTFGRIDVLVNSASLYPHNSFPCESYELFDQAFGVTVYGSLYCANEAAKIMLRQNNGLIINIVDLFAFHPRKNMMFHGVSKAALASLTQYLAIELSPTIRVNAIAPGPVLPPTQYSQEKLQQSSDRTLLKRWGEPSDVTRAVMYLVESDYITGEIMYVDGGSHINQGV
ncbi:SDR family NAD(P)-dependent oxidoreductase [Legionella sp. CNM-4043-24]|uniref:SDR family NAD(P)-dependent oxidoreductase n=1 Tax=Legionella sp. CNM-4043-24 TaxID=3421646 RepID=UPI00403A9ACD